MTTADDHWPTTLQRVVGALKFEIEDPGRSQLQIRAKSKDDASQLPALVTLALQAALEMDRRVANADPEPPVDRATILARKDLARAMTDGAHSMLLTGYATAYRLELARVLWAGIADAPRRRLEELARPQAS